VRLVGVPDDECYMVQIRSLDHSIILPDLM
jgi:hypothetical protein